MDYLFQFTLNLFNQVLYGRIDASSSAKICKSSQYIDFSDAESTKPQLNISVLEGQCTYRI